MISPRISVECTNSIASSEQNETRRAVYV